MPSYIRTRWSKIKRGVESRFAESVAGRVTLFMTGYHAKHNEIGRWAFRVDGTEVYDVGDLTSWGSNPVSVDPALSRQEGERDLRQKGLHDRDSLLESLREYLSLDIDAAHNSPDVVIRSLAILDRRTGKKRLRTLISVPIGHPLMRRCLELRCEAENIHMRLAENDQSGNKASSLRR